MSPLAAANRSSGRKSGRLKILREARTNRRTAVTPARILAPRSQRVSRSDESLIRVPDLAA
jgi:hypothetical protein